MNLSARILYDTLIISPPLRFDARVHADFQRILSQAHKAGCQYVWFDFQKVVWIDSSGLGMVFLASHQVRQKGCRVWILGARESICAILARVDLSSVVDIVGYGLETRPAA